MEIKLATIRSYVVARVTIEASRGLPDTRSTGVNLRQSFDQPGTWGVVLHIEPSLTQTQT